MAFWESASRNFNIRRHRKPVNEILLIPDFADPSKLRMREARTLNLELSIMVLPKGWWSETHRSRHSARWANGGRGSVRTNCTLDSRKISRAPLEM